MRLKNKKIAICFSGAPRSLNITNDNIKNFINNSFGTCDIFGYVPFCKTANQLEKFFPEANVIKAMDQYIDDGKIPIFNRFPPHSGKQAYLQQLNGLKQVNLMRKQYEKQHNIKYDFVVRCRMDVKYTTSLPELEYQKDRLYIPDFHHHGGINDRFCIGSPELIDNYMNALDVYHKNPSICIHAESFLLHCLKINNTPIELIKLKFNRVKENGDECYWDSTDP